MIIYLIITVLLLFILFFFIVTQYFAHKRYNYLQETSIAIMIGFITGLCTYLSSQFFQEDSQNAQQFIKDTIILLLLPPIMFEDGYNFPRRKFFQNFQFINLFGILGTIMNFFIVWGILYACNISGLFVSVSDIQEQFILLNWQILLIASALCSIQPVVTEKVVDKETYPKLFSIIFGQCLYKDTFAITMFEAINDYVSDNNSYAQFDIQGSDIGFLILRFLEVFAGSILIGVAIGILTTVIFKNMRFLVKENGTSEVAITIASGFLCYVLSQWATFSGVISMLFCGTVLAHYNVYNMTEEGKVSTKTSIEVLKITACGVIFFFIGFQIFNIQSFQSAIDQASKLTFSASLLGCTFLALFAGRVVNIFLISLLGWAFTSKEKWRLNIYEILILFLAGLVHGAVPFALGVTMPEIIPTDNCSQLNIIAVVLITSLFFNVLIPKFQKILLSKIRQLAITDPTHPSVKESFALKRLASGKTIGSIIGKEVEQPLLDKYRSPTQKYWKKFDQGILKPFLIFDYYQRKEQIKLQKLKERMEEHHRYLHRYGDPTDDPQNILNPNNQEHNVFYEISNSESSGSSSPQQKGVIKLRLSKQTFKKSEKSKGQEERPEQQINFNNSRINASQGGQYKQSSQNQRKRRVQTQFVSLPLMKEQKRQLSQGQIEIKIQQKQWRQRQ